MIIKSIKILLKSFGIIAFNRSSRVYIAEDESYRIVANLVDRPDPVVIDGGAHLGDMVDKFCAFLPSSIFYCFEPDKTLVYALQKKYSDSPDVHIVQAALGDISGTAKFNINASRATNSLLSFSEDLQPSLKQYCQFVEQVEVEVLTIDGYCLVNSINRVDVIKLDLQGYDYLALKGSKATLEKTKIVLIEVLFDEIYKGYSDFSNILNLMVDQGFKLHTLCGLHYGEADQLLWADAIFTKLNQEHPSK